MSKDITTESIIERLKREPLPTVVADVLGKAGAEFETHLGTLSKHASTEGIEKDIRAGLDLAILGLEQAKKAASGPAMESLAKAILHTAHTVSKHVPLRFHDRERELSTPMRTKGPGDIPLDKGKRGAVKEFVAAWKKANPRGKGGALKEAAKKAGLNPSSAAVAFYKKK